MQTSTVFDFLVEKQLLTPFLQQVTLADLEKEDLLIIVEKLLNPTYTQNVSYDTENIVPSSGIVESNKVVVNNTYRTKTVKLSLQEVYDRLVNEGIASRDNFGKQVVNKIAIKLGLIEKFYYPSGVTAYRPTECGKQLGLTVKNGYAIWFNLESYDEIKLALLNKPI